MSMMKIAASIVLAILLTFLFLYRSDVYGFLVFGRRFFSSQLYADYNRLGELELENESLKNELLKLRSVPQDEVEEYLNANVYSRYPLNDEGFLVIDVGSERGVKVSMPVLAAENVLIGRIKNVKRTTSEVETIFSTSWKNSVLIKDESGEGTGVKAVLEGLPVKPKLNLINKPTVEINDRIINISPDFPYGLFIGRLIEIATSSATPWLTGTVGTPYRLDTIHKVLIVKNFKE